MGFTGISIAVAMIAQSQGLLIGAIFMEDASAAVFLGPITCIPLMLFAGFFVRISTIPLYFKPITYISYLRYSFEAYISVLYGYDRCVFDPNLANQTNTKPEWFDFLSQALAPQIGGTEGESNPENFIQTLMDNLSGQFSAASKGDYQSVVMSQFQVDEQSLILNLVILGLFFVVLRVMTYFILLWKVNRRD